MSGNGTEPIAKRLRAEAASLRDDFDEDDPRDKWALRLADLMDESAAIIDPLGDVVVLLTEMRGFTVGGPAWDFLLTRIDGCLDHLGVLPAVQRACGDVMEGR